MSNAMHAFETRSGAARRLGAVATLLVLLGAVLVGAAVLGVLLFSTSGGEDAAVRPAAAATPTARRIEAPEEGLVADSPIELGGGEEWRDKPKTFDGVATISGIVEAASGHAFPPAWTIVVEPSLYSIGRQNAVTRRVDLPGNQRTFEVRDLPMGGYRVFAEARDYQCPPQEVLLFKVEGYEDLPGRDHARVLLRFEPAGFLDGVVVDADGQPVEGLPVTLQRVRTGERRTATTGPTGLYAFEKVIDGRYRIVFGNENQPLLEPEEFLFRAPELRFEDRVVERLASVRFEIIDELGRGMPDAVIRGFGGAPIDVRTDSVGWVTVRFLPAGHYKVRVDASASGLDRAGKMDFMLMGDEVEKHVQILCREE